MATADSGRTFIEFRLKKGAVTVSHCKKKKQKKNKQIVELKKEKRINYHSFGFWDVTIDLEEVKDDIRRPAKDEHWNNNKLVIFIKKFQRQWLAIVDKYQRQ
jgi:Cft2 family RNA processing exonuclease